MILGDSLFTVGKNFTQNAGWGKGPTIGALIVTTSFASIILLLLCCMCALICKVYSPKVIDYMRGKFSKIRQAVNTEYSVQVHYDRETAVIHPKDVSVYREPLLDP